MEGLTLCLTVALAFSPLRCSTFDMNPFCIPSWHGNELRPSPLYSTSEGRGDVPSVNYERPDNLSINRLIAKASFETITTWNYRDEKVRRKQPPGRDAEC